MDKEKQKEVEKDIRGRFYSDADRLLLLKIDKQQEEIDKLKEALEGKADKDHGHRRRPNFNKLVFGR